MSPFRTLAALLFSALFAVSLCAQQSSRLTLTTATTSSGAAIPPDFLGLSFETADMLPRADGRYPYFRSDNRNLVQLFRTLGIRSLRLGGNTSDRPGVPVPGKRDIDELFGFARATGVHVIYTLRLRNANPHQDAPLAKYLMDHDAANISCLVIGNEPDVYEKQYPRYRDDLRSFLSVILAPGVAPTAKICGPSTTPGHPDWSDHFVTDFGPGGHIQWITQHSYPGGNGKKVTDPAAQQARILAPAFADHYQKLADQFAPAVDRAHLQYRIEETNSFYNGGAKDVSNTFASSLWALNYLYWWAAHRSQGVNFHTGDSVAAGPVQTICWYGIFHSLPGGGYEIRPIAYAMKAFSLTARGRLVSLSGLPSDQAIYAHAIDDSSAHTLHLVLIDAQHGPGVQAVAITLNPATQYAHAESMLLSAPNNDISATSGVTLGGAAIAENGTWDGKWSRLALHRGHVQLTLQPATALLLKLTARR